MPTPRLYRFFYHFNRSRGEMTVHFRGACHFAKNVKCLVPSETKWSDRQPRLVMQGFAAGLRTQADGTLVIRN